MSVKTLPKTCVCLLWKQHPILLSSARVSVPFDACIALTVTSVRYNVREFAFLDPADYPLQNGSSQLTIAALGPWCGWEDQVKKEMVAPVRA